MSYNYKRFEIKPGEHFITVIYLGSGWAAVEMWLNNENYNETYQEEECFFFLNLITLALVAMPQKKKQ